MNGRITTLVIAVMLTGTLTASASSPFSTLGAGVRVDALSVRSFALGGVDILTADSIYISTANPAGWKSDGRTRFLMSSDVMLSSAEDRQSGTDTAGNLRFPAVALAMPIYRTLGIGFAYKTLTDYTFLTRRSSTISGLLPEDSTSSYDVTETFSGVGGLSAFSTNFGVSLGHSLAMGVALDYVFGKLDRVWILQFSNGDFSSSGKTIRHELSGVLVRVGTHYSKGPLMVAATVQLPASISVHRSLEIVGGDSLGIPGGSFEMPLSLSAGAAWMVGRVRTFGQGSFESWSSVTQDVIGSWDTYSDAWNARLGVELLPTRFPLDPWYKKWTYRAGGHLGHEYISADSHPMKTMGISMGVGIPVRTHMGMLDLALTMDWRGDVATNGVRERITGIRLGFSSTERWFVRRPR
ncbi:MAG: hypothetical protein V2A56_08695 [bacterium]